ncbi:MAG: hypothetical protein VX847_02070 [Pseudomonadota bacterium]|nr:hypothetical protein [Pseudomonadota bacterium]
MNRLISYFFAFNLILFCFVACETKDDSSGFYSGDSLATKKTESYNGKTNIEEKETSVENIPAVIEEAPQIDEEELDYK